MTARHDVLIVGAGHAGTQAVIALRQRGFAGSIALLGDEPDLPYERPPLTKDYLLGTRSFERMLIRPSAFYTDRAITLLPGRTVVAIDPDARRVTDARGGAIDYGTLVWATGGAPRRLTCGGHDLRGVHAVRSRADADRLLAELPQVRRVVVVGGGYVGLEAAAALVTLGREVTLVEAAPRFLSRVAGEALSRVYEAEHRARGVTLRLGAAVTCIEGRGGAASGVRLADGAVLPCEMVIVGIGIVPAVAPLLAAGAVSAAGGVLVDAVGRTSLPYVHAAGDAAAQRNRYAGDIPVRIESVGNAHHQAALVAAALTEGPPPAPEVPWFWSNQYDLKLQTVGWSAGHDAAIVRGDPATRAFAIVYLRSGRVVALDCVNQVRDYVAGRALVAAGARIDPGTLADPAVPLKSLAPPA